MSEKFTVAEEAIITKASQDLHRYGKICEEHSVILRRDVEGSIKAHQEYTANSPPMDFMPPRDEFDHYTEVSEKVLTSECRTALDHLHVIHAGFFLARILMKMMSEYGERVYGEFIRRKVELDKKYPYLSPTESPFETIHVPSESSPSADSAPSDDVDDYPTSLPARAFNSTEVINLPRVPIQETELTEYQLHPELLQNETFISFNEDDQDQEEGEVFRIPMFITTSNQERIFYVVYADEGPEAVAFTSIHLFDLLRTSERVQVDN